jgi:hypothetical protein
MQGPRTSWLQFNGDDGGQSANTLSQLAQQHREALIAHLAGLAAVEHFYSEVLICQWRLDALDAQHSMLEEIFTPAMFPAPRSVPTEGMPDESSASNLSSTRRDVALQHCLNELSAQRSSAVTAVRERASQYTVPTLSSWGTIGSATAHTTHTDARVLNLKICSPPTRKDLQPDVNRYLEAIHNTYNDVEAETRAIVAAVPDDGVERLNLDFGRRRAFWVLQLEETWSAWEQATCNMHLSGESAARVWSDIMTATPMYLLVKGEVSSMSPTLLQGLASVAAAGFELELLQLTCARCSSVGCSEEVFDSGSQTSHEPHRLLLSVLKCLGEACALHEVGKLLADSHAIVTSALPVEHLEVAEAVARCGDAELVLAWLTRMGSRGQWIVWLVDILSLCILSIQNKFLRGSDPRF